MITIINLSGNSQTVKLDFSGNMGAYEDYFEGKKVELASNLTLNLEE